MLFPLRCLTLLPSCNDSTSWQPSYFLTSHLFNRCSRTRLLFQPDFLAKCCVSRTHLHAALGPGAVLPAVAGPDWTGLPLLHLRGAGPAVALRGLDHRPLAPHLTWKGDRKWYVNSKVKFNPAPKQPVRFRPIWPLDGDLFTRCVTCRSVYCTHCSYACVCVCFGLPE